MYVIERNITRSNVENVISSLHEIKNFKCGKRIHFEPFDT